MFQILEYIKIAIRNILSSKGRSFLTMLGIIIGIMSVILVITVGNAVSGSVSGELDSFGGGGMIDIYVNSQETDADVELTQSDIDFLMEKVDHIKGITPVYNYYGTSSGPKGNYTSMVMAGNTALQYYSSDPLIRGRYFNESDNESGAQVCVITRSSAVNLFGTDNVVGLSFDMNLYGRNTQMRIIGIREDNQSRIISMAMGGEDYVTAEVPYYSLASMFGMDDSYYDLIIFPDSPLNATEVAQKCMQLLNARKQTRGTDILQIQSMVDYTSQIDSVMGYITIFVSLVAAISLLVGGIGVMNIMLVSVTERTREIGIRKALGARTGSILLQFLAEAGIITLLGGLIGIALGVSIAIAVCNVLGFTPVVNPAVAISAALFSAAVGIFFGIYPARKAAHLSPIEALRYE